MFFITVENELGGQVAHGHDKSAMVITDKMIAAKKHYQGDRVIIRMTNESGHCFGELKTFEDESSEDNK